MSSVCSCFMELPVTAGETGTSWRRASPHDALSCRLQAGIGGPLGTRGGEEALIQELRDLLRWPGVAQQVALRPLATQLAQLP